MSPAGRMASTDDTICPISSSPCSVSPSKIPRLEAALPKMSRSSSELAPRASASATLSNSPFRTRRVGDSFLRQSIVPPSSKVRQRCLKASEAELSVDRAKRVPICTPSAPNAMAANIASPLPIPPAATTGRPVARRTCGIRVRVVVSSRPLCPPASNPSATMASTPASSHFRANLLLDTTWATVTPAS